MQLGIRLHDTRELPLPERLEEVKKQGFACAHVALSKVITENTVDNGALTPGYAMYLKRLFWEKEIDFAVLGCYLNLAHPEAESLKAIQQKYLAHIRFAALLGCGVVGTETGAPNADYRYEPACRSREALTQFIQGLEPVVRYAEQMGVIVAIEPVAKHIVYSAARAREVLDTIASPNLQIILDPVNLLDMDNYQNQTAVIEEAVKLLGEDTVVVHIKDYIAADNELKAVAAGQGQMDYDPIIRFIKKQKPYMHVTLENTAPENALAVRKYIQGLWDQA